MNERIQVTLPRLRTYASPQKHADAWGLPTWDVDSFAHHSNAGWGALTLPSMCEVYGWAVKAAKHKDRVPFLFMLARVSLYSQLTLSEAVTLGRELRELEPSLGNLVMAESWVVYGRTVVDLWEFRRRDGKGVGDEWRNMTEFRALMSWLRSRKIEYLQSQLDDLRAHISKEHEGE